MDVASTLRGLPILSLGQLHVGDRNQRQMEREMFAPLAALGYRALFLELYKGLNGNLQEFLQSNGSAEEAVRFWRAYAKLQIESNFIYDHDPNSKKYNRDTLRLPPAEREEVYWRRGLFLQKKAALQHLLNLAWAAKEQGMRVALIDGNPGQDFKASQKAAASDQGLRQRNRIMAQAIAESIADYPEMGAMVITGPLHVATAQKGVSSIAGELKALGVTKVLSVVWGRDGLRSDAFGLHSLAASLPPVDAVAHNPQELIEAVEKKMSREQVKEQLSLAAPKMTWSGKILSAVFGTREREQQEDLRAA